MIDKILLIDSIQRMNSVQLVGLNDIHYTVIEIRAGQIVALTEKGMPNIFNAEDVGAIRLTEDFLKLHGLISEPDSGDDSKFFHPDGVIIIFNAENDSFMIAWKELESMQIHFVHQLQNFFSLFTGRQLSS